MLIPTIFFFPALGISAQNTPLETRVPNLIPYSLWADAPSPVPLPKEWPMSPKKNLSLSNTAQKQGSPSVVFVRLRLNMSPSSNLKDSLADLGQEAGFQPDQRFDPVFKGAKDEAFVWGWLPSKGIGKAALIPAVEKISFSKNKAANKPNPQKEELIIGLRVDTSISKTLSQDLPALQEQTQLEIEKTIGYQPVPQSDQIALIFLGKIPISNISLLLDQPEVIKVIPFLALSKPANSPHLNSNKNSLVPHEKNPLLIGLSLGLLIGIAAGTLGRIVKRQT